MITSGCCTMEGDLRLGVSSCSFYYGVETVVLVSGVFNNTSGSVGLKQAVGAFDHVAVTGFPLALNVACVRVVNGVVEFIMHWPLINKSTTV
jgi:hypothetical protein